MGDYLSLQNMIEVLMISLSVAFFAIENIEQLDNDIGILEFRIKEHVVY